MGGTRDEFQDVKSVLRRFGGTDVEARKQYCEYLKEGLANTSSDDDVTMLVRKSNAGIEAGRKAACWVIGDQKFVREVISSAEAHRLRISRFEHEGADLIKIATKIGKHFGVTVQTIQIRQRGGACTKGFCLLCMPGL